VLLVALSACSSWSGVHEPLGRGRRALLPYASYRALENGTSAREIVHKFGPPEQVEERDGRIRALVYRCETSSGEVSRLELRFSEDERLEGTELRSR